MFSKKSQFLKSLDMVERQCYRQYEKQMSFLIETQRNWEKDSSDPSNSILNKFVHLHGAALRAKGSLADLYDWGFKRKSKGDKRFNGLMIEEYLAVIEKSAILECSYIYSDLFSPEKAVEIIQSDAANFIDTKWKELKPKTYEEATGLMRSSNGLNGYLWRYSLMVPLQLKINDKFKK
jgi:hypothetical protein